MQIDFITSWLLHQSRDVMHILVMLDTSMRDELQWWMELPHTRNSQSLLPQVQSRAETNQQNGYLNIWTLKQENI